MEKSQVLTLAINLDEIKTLLKEHHLLKRIQVGRSRTFNNVSYDSRTVKRNGLFFCKGNFKPRYLTSARKNGGTGYVSERSYPEGRGLTAIIVTDVRKAMALLGAAYYDYPQDHLFVIAYTGTKGKTTSAYFTRSVLQQPTRDRVAMSGTIETFLGKGEKYKSQLTTPESLDTFKNMRRAVDNGMTAFIMEVSSQAYLKNRVYGLQYDVGLFLNLTPDHIGPNEHPNFANYMHCAEQVLVNSKVCVINAETDHLQDIYYAAKSTTAPTNIYLFDRTGSHPQLPVPIDFQFRSLKDTMSANQIVIRGTSNQAKQVSINGTYQLAMPGDYNESNATAAAIASGLDGAAPQEIDQGLKRVTVPGRMERYFSRQHGTVYVDYAHDYGSVHALLSFLRRENQVGRIIIVLGSTGDKGVNRRSGFGKALTEHANVAFLTMDDPGFEDPLKIAKEIDAHIDHRQVQVHFEMDRPKAIREAITMGKPHDMIVIAGKGRDPYQKIRGKNVPYATDSVIVQKILKG